MPSAWLYILLNASASVVALHLIQAYNWPSADLQSQPATQVMIAGTGSMVLLRSSLFNLKVDAKVVPIGPSAFLLPLLDAADRGVDRVRARSRSEEVTRIMAGVSFMQAKVALPAFCLSLMQNAPADDQERLRRAVDALESNKEMTDAQKAKNLGLLIMNFAGPATLEAAIKAHGEEILSEMQPMMPAPVRTNSEAGAG
ncbi:hypothetical protein ACQP2T_56095 [Nonomuraea sp. CA-143628]|uniref:hypothetical protein n=1 Tax=Nonomuraea sp. CA-143628 TaxID=3239997 RepID=UPI003D9082F2